MKKSVFLTVALVVLFLALAPCIQAGQPGTRVVLSWQVQFGVLRYNQYWDTRLLLQSNVPTSVNLTTYFHWGIPSSVTMPVGPVLTERWFAGPPYSFEANGFQLALSQNEPSFVGIRNNGQLLPGVTFHFIRHLRRDEVGITNTANQILYYSVNGESRMRALAAGKTFYRQYAASGEVRLYTEKGNVWSECASIWWRR